MESKEVKLAECAIKPFEEFREEFPALCTNPAVTTESVEKAARQIFSSLSKLSLTVQEAHAFLSMIQHEIGSFYLGRHSDAK
ncbi:MAG: hypothetical protein HFG27_08400 [Provencibacterium sp.]|jgi:hypothetical protein|nr:hypothetical protein [Provencibacterium sp.]